MNSNGELLDGKEKDRILNRVVAVNNFYSKRGEFAERKRKKQQTLGENNMTTTTATTPENKQTTIPAVINHQARSTQPIVTPAVSVEEAVFAWEQYERLKAAIVKPEDWIIINGQLLEKTCNLLQSHG
jgi:hypothetical protein